MPTATKNHTEKKAETAEHAAKPAETKEKTVNAPVQKASVDIFAKIKEVSGTSSKKVDEWQKTWLAMPETRKKYEHLADAPEVVGEELLAITNDVINFVQKQEGGQSVVFKKIKAGFGKLLKTPIDYFKAVYQKNKEKTATLADKAKESAGQVKATAEKAKTESEAKIKATADKAKEVKAESESKVKATAEKAKKTVEKPTKK
jgi:hypothetical protein